MKRSLLALLTALILASSALSGTITYNAMGTTSGGYDVNSSATFQTSLNSITVTLSNFLANPASIQQNLSGLFFTLSMPPSAASTLNSSSGTELSVAANGSYTLGPTGSTGWSFSSADDVFTLKVSGMREHTLIGPSNNGTYSGGTYSNGNNSIKGNSANNPFLKSDITFTISAPGVTDATTITDARFRFGIGNDSCLLASQAVPEPSTWAFMALGVAGLLGRFALVRHRSA